MAGGVIAEWYHADGATVDVGEVVCRVESAFIAFEVEAEGPGLLRHRLPAGSIERSGAVLGLILAPDEAMPPDEAPRAVAEEESLQATDELEVTESVANEQAAPENEESPAERSPLPEFEEALVEAIVVPFPRQFAGTSGRDWDEVPGDAVEFDSSLFGEGDHDRTTTLTEPGGSIPGLPLWDLEDASHAPVKLGATAQRFGRIRDESSAAAQVLTMTMTVDLTEAERMRAAFEREWQPEGPSPMLEDVVFRAIAWALEDTPFGGGTGAMLVATTDSDLAFGVREPAARSFRAGVEARAAVRDEAFESADWLFVSLAALGVSSATPRLEAGRHMSFALGAEDALRRASLKIAYDSSRWSEGSAARLLARVRDILDLPYAMLT
jgi:pyruvate/2-oxoglutarate dehydrogenase complex dihydrolipoamide acyltransferase (E2) component